MSLGTLIDFSAGVPDAAAVRAAGHAGAVRYVSPPREAWMVGKPVTRVQADAYRAAGLTLVSNWQKGKAGTADWRRGRDGGVADAREADRIHRDAGGPSSAPIFFSIDDDIMLAEWNRLAAEYLRGAASVIGRQRVGVYGHSRACAWAVEDDLVGHSTTVGRRWLWQTRAWSGSVIDQRAVIYQRVIDTAASPGPKVGGVTVDVNDILADDYGQWDRHDAGARPPVEQEDPVKPEYTETVALTGGASNRWGAQVVNWLIHTEQGNATAAALAAYCSNPANGVSYHYIGRNRIVYSIVDTDKASWSVLDHNPRSINFCFAGSYAEWSREQWLEREDDIAICAWLAVQDAKKYGFAVEVIAPPYGKARPGIADHNYVTRVLRIGTHTDVGAGFPWDRLEHYVDLYSRGVAPAPVVNMIDQEAKVAAGWIGKRIDKEEIRTPDGKGRFAGFENGYIYWSPETGAYAIPTAVFEVYARYGYEAGFLGYPVGRHTVLHNPDTGDAWGDVQGFEGGAIYRRYGTEGWPVTGMIRAYWNRQGFETGKFGWPVSDEQDYDGGKYQDFEHGRIFWAGNDENVIGTHQQGGEWDGIATEER